jgi:hypothetical protein
LDKHSSVKVFIIQQMLEQLLQQKHKSKPQRFGQLLRSIELIVLYLKQQELLLIQKKKLFGMEK